jgi:hypothetical protein
MHTYYYAPKHAPKEWQDKNLVKGKGERDEMNRNWKGLFHLWGFICSRFAPQAQLVLFCTHVDNHSTNFIAFCELLTDACQKLIPVPGKREISVQKWRWHTLFSSRLTLKGAVTRKCASPLQSLQLRMSISSKNCLLIF